MTSRDQWAFTELDTRRREDARWPQPPDPTSPDYPAFAQSRGDRAKRRKARGYSRATAQALVDWAASQERAAA